MRAWPSANQRGSTRADRLLRALATGAIAASVVSVISTAVALLVPPLRATAAHAFDKRAHYQTRQSIELPRAVYRDSTVTIVAFMRSSCPAAERSGQALRALAAQARHDSSQRFVVVADRRDEYVGELLTTVGIGDAELTRADFALIALRRLPTVLVVDGTGRVASVHEGVVGDAEGGALADVASALTAAGSRSR